MPPPFPATTTDHNHGGNGARWKWGARSGAN